MPGDVQGVVGASEDGSYLYFVARAVLSGEEEGPTGEKAEEGADNLYLYHGGKAGFIARLAPGVPSPVETRTTGPPSRKG